MSNEPHDEHLKRWQRQPLEGRTPSAADVRRRIDELATKVRRRDLVMYLSGAVIVPSWAAVMWLFPDLRFTAGAALATAVWLVYQLRMRSAAQGVTGDLAGGPSLGFHRGLLRRESGLYRNSL